MKLYIAQLNPIVGDLEGNTEKIIAELRLAKAQEADLALFSELVLCGYPPHDLVLLDSFIEACQLKLDLICKETQGLGALIGLPRFNPDIQEKNLYNSAAFLFDQKIIGYQDKRLLPTYDVFSERRYFEPAGKSQFFTLKGKKIAVTICEDLWQHSGLLKDVDYRHDPIVEIGSHKPDLLLNLSASPFSQNRGQERFKAVQKAALTLKCPVVLCNQVGGNDSLIFDGRSLAVDEKGELLCQGKSFLQDSLILDLNQKALYPFSPLEPMEELFSALVLGLKDYFAKTGFKTALIGLSGGIDSAVVACIAKEALGKKNVFCLSLPSRYSSSHSKQDAKELAEALGCDYKEVSIEDPFKSYLALLPPHFEEPLKSITEENLQARIRGMILMAFSNQFGHLVLSTGNKSEMALGYSTLYGDLCGGIAVIGDVVKTKVYELAQWINRNGPIIPQSTIDKEPSAELKPNQKDSDTLPDYAIIDAVLEDYVEKHLSHQAIAQKRGFSLNVILDLISRIHKNEYKRRQSPPVLRVTTKAFSAGRHFPIAQKLS